VIYNAPMRWSFIAIVMVAGCADKATPDYTKCVDFDAKGMLDQARAACVAAVNADGTSKDGVAAAAKIVEIDAKVNTQKATAVAEAAASVARDVKSRQDDAELRCKGKKWATKCMTGHRPDGSEKWTGMQTFDTRADCVRAVVGAGTCDECACM
jgi:hypothetical protein